MSYGNSQLVTGLDNIEKIQITRAVFGDIHHLATKYDMEVCGGLYGHVQQRVLTITHSQNCQNFAHSKNSFILDLEELSVPPEDLSPNNGAGLAGIYHSHVDELPYLSQVDHYFLSLAHWIWLVAGRLPASMDVSILCFRKVDSIVRSVDYVVI